MPAGSGGPVSGPQDMHCSGMTLQSTNQGDCSLRSDGGVVGDGGTTYGRTLDNQEGDDDDCKYHMKWTSTPIAENQDVTFTVTATYKTNGMPSSACSGCPVEGLDTDNFYVELGYSDATHAAPSTNQVVAETSTKGTYTIGPVQFDEPGQWYARFHFFELCSDVAADSPHGHAAFFIKVP
jgi:hypothetical protein